MSSPGRKSTARYTIAGGIVGHAIGIGDGTARPWKKKQQVPDHQRKEASK